MRAIMFFILSFSLVVDYKYREKGEKTMQSNGFVICDEQGRSCPRSQSGVEVHGVDRVDRDKEADGSGNHRPQYRHMRKLY